MTDFWVFGYGSLMWNPGFHHEEVRPALLRGAHRSLCVYSWVHRGTKERPGLVFGLDRGGACRGLAYKVNGARRDETLDYLRAREQTTMVYLETWRKISFDIEEDAEALVYIVDRDHDQYAGALPLNEQQQIIEGAVGKSGENPEYVLNTADHLEELGIVDHKLQTLARALKKI